MCSFLVGYIPKFKPVTKYTCVNQENSGETARMHSYKNQTLTHWLILNLSIALETSQVR